ncbi:Short-chain dehydrogenase TIC 32, chloroplastic, partial [Capsicum annuum]
MREEGRSRERGKERTARKYFFGELSLEIHRTYHRNTPTVTVPAISSQEHRRNLYSPSKPTTRGPKSSQILLRFNCSGKILPGNNILLAGNPFSVKSIIGASSGIGAETSRVLALRGVHVIMAVRNIAAGNGVKEAIVKEVPAAKVDIMELDLSSLASVRKCAADFISSGHSLNMLINNAGVVGIPFMLSKDNIELQFATNHLGHFLLTNLLLNKMEETTRKTKREGRIVNVSSVGYCIFTYREGIRFDRISDPKSYSSFWAYGQSKLANILHTYELTRRLKEEGVEITANSLHPGVITTNMFRHLGIFDGFASKFGKFIFKNVQQ